VAWAWLAAFEGLIEQISQWPMIVSCTSRIELAPGLSAFEKLHEPHDGITDNTTQPIHEYYYKIITTCHNHTESRSALI
jgi:hypothetical protein